jgi:hypothetical protein
MTVRKIAKEDEEGGMDRSTPPVWSGSSFSVKAGDGGNVQLKGLIIVLVYMV